MIGKNSRYASGILIRDMAGNSLGTRSPIDTSPRHDDRFHTVTGEERLDQLAHRYLGDARLWWIIADYNGLYCPLDLEVGAVLRIPSVEHVQMRLTYS